MKKLEAKIRVFGLNIPLKTEIDEVTLEVIAAFFSK